MFNKKRDLAEGKVVKGRRGALIVLPLIGALALGFGVFGALGAFNAFIDNNSNTFGVTSSNVLNEYAGPDTTGTLVCTSQGTGSTQITDGVPAGSGACGEGATGTSKDGAVDLFGGGTDGAQTGISPGTWNDNYFTFANGGTGGDNTVNAAVDTAGPFGGIHGYRGGTNDGGGCYVNPDTTNGNTVVGTDLSGFCNFVDVAVYDVTTNTCLVGACSQTGAVDAPGAGTNVTLANLSSNPFSFVGVSHPSSAELDFETQLDPSYTNEDQGLYAAIGVTFTLNP